MEGLHLATRVFLAGKHNRAKEIGSLSTRVVEKRTATESEYFAHQDSGLSQNFKLMVSNSEKIPRDMWLRENKLKGKTAHFGLLSASQKATCLSSRLVTSNGIKSRKEHERRGDEI